MKGWHDKPTLLPVYQYLADQSLKLYQRAYIPMIDRCRRVANAIYYDPSVNSFIGSRKFLKRWEKSYEHASDTEKILAAQIPVVQFRRNPCWPEQYDVDTTSKYVSKWTLKRHDDRMGEYIRWLVVGTSRMAEHSLPYYVTFLDRILLAMPSDHVEREGLYRIRNKIHTEVEAIFRSNYGKIQSKIMSILSGERIKLANSYGAHYLIRQGILQVQASGDIASLTPFWFFLFHDYLIGYSLQSPNSSSAMAFSSGNQSREYSFAIPLCCTWIIDLPAVEGELGDAVLLVSPEKEIIVSARSVREKIDWLGDLHECIVQCSNAGHPCSPEAVVRRATKIFNLQGAKDCFKYLKSHKYFSVLCACRDCMQERSKESVEVSDGDELKESTTLSGRDFDDVEHEYLSFALFLFENEELDKSNIGEFLGRPEDISVGVLRAYVNLFPVTGVTFEKAIRQFLLKFKPAGESQTIDRIMGAFAKHFTVSNPTVFRGQDTAHVLAFSVIMLNTDAHNPSVKKKMSEEEFIRNNREIDDGYNVPLDYLTEIYRNIQQIPFQVHHTKLNPEFFMNLWVVNNPGTWLSYERLVRLRHDTRRLLPYENCFYRNDPTSLSLISSEIPPLCPSRRYASYRYVNNSFYKGQWANGKRHGNGKILHATGSKFDGEWEMDEMQGQGELTYRISLHHTKSICKNPSATTPTHIRRIKSNNSLSQRLQIGSLKHVGTEEVTSSSSSNQDAEKTTCECTFAGTWKKFTGSGTVRYDNGRSFLGRWSVQRTHHENVFMFGKFIYLDSESTYMGALTNHEISGFGHMRYINNSRYLGMWRSSLRNGFGLIISEDGNMFVGNWGNDIIDGHGCWYSSNGVIVEGRFKGLWGQPLKIEDATLTPITTQTTFSISSTKMDHWNSFGAMFIWQAALLVVDQIAEEDFNPWDHEEWELLGSTPTNGVANAARELTVGSAGSLSGLGASNMELKERDLTSFLQNGMKYVPVHRLIVDVAAENFASIMETALVDLPENMFRFFLPHLASLIPALADVVLSVFSERQLESFSSPDLSTRTAIMEKFFTKGSYGKLIFQWFVDKSVDTENQMKSLFTVANIVTEVEFQVVEEGEAVINCELGEEEESSASNGHNKEQTQRSDDASFQGAKRRVRNLSFSKEPKQKPLKTSSARRSFNPDQLLNLKNITTLLTKLNDYHSPWAKHECLLKAIDYLSKSKEVAEESILDVLTTSILVVDIPNFWAQVEMMKVFLEDQKGLEADPAMKYIGSVMYHIHKMYGNEETLDTS